MRKYFTLSISLVVAISVALATSSAHAAAKKKKYRYRPHSSTRMIPKRYEMTPSQYNLCKLNQTRYPVYDIRCD